MELGETTISSGPQETTKGGTPTFIDIHLNSVSPFPYGTCSLSVIQKYLGLEV